MRLTGGRQCMRLGIATEQDTLSAIQELRAIARWGEGPTSVGGLRLEGGRGGARLRVVEEGGGLLQDELQLDQLAEAARQALRIAIHLQQLALQLLQAAL